MNRREALAHIYANPGSKARQESWKSNEFIVVTPDGRLFNEEKEGVFLNMSIETSWEIIKEPIKYEVTIWLSGDPRLNLDAQSESLQRSLFDRSQYAIEKVGSFNKQFKITVEEVSK